ncbi:hypothetical protein FQN57_006722 [Myotisia sp. PD_48]|nr:hypothetical protein FQN57_006722 [Myotisia sp. PD_48]
MSGPPWDYIAKLVCIGDSGTGKSSLTIRLCVGSFTTVHDVTIGVEFGSRVIPVGPPASDELGLNFDESAPSYFSTTSTTTPTTPSPSNINNVLVNEDENQKIHKQSPSESPSAQSLASRLPQKRSEPPVQKRMKLSIWDTAGQETYKSITRSYFRGTSGAVLVFDITRRSTFTSLNQWLQDLRQIAEEGIVVILVGNKSDLVHSDSLENGHAANNMDNNGMPIPINNKRAVTREEAEDWCRANNILRYVETSAKSGDGVERAFREIAERIYRNIQQDKYDLTDRRSGVKRYGAKAGGVNGRLQPTVTLGIPDAMKGGVRGWGGGSTE